MAKKTKKTTGKELVAWDKEFADLAKETSKHAKVSDGKFLSFGGGKMSFAGADIDGDEVRCVIVGWVYHNAYYDPDIRFDPKNPQAPICYAFDPSPPEDGEMAPLDNVPEKQCDDCASCPFQQWESAKQGKGKACKNTIRLALIAEDDLEDIENAEVIYASIPPKSLKNFLKYCVDLRDKAKRPLWSVITLLSRLPDDESQFRLTFKNDDLIEDADLFQPLKDLWESSMETINFPYVVRERESSSRGGKSRGGNKKDKPEKRPVAEKKAQKFARR